MIEMIITPLPQDASNSTVMTLSGLNPSTTYYFYRDAIDYTPVAADDSGAGNYVVDLSSPTDILVLAHPHHSVEILNGEVYSGQNITIDQYGDIQQTGDIDGEVYIYGSHNMSFYGNGYKIIADGDQAGIILMQDNSVGFFNVDVESFTVGAVIGDDSNIIINNSKFMIDAGANQSEGINIFSSSYISIASSRISPNGAEEYGIDVSVTDNASFRGDIIGDLSEIPPVTLAYPNNPTDIVGAYGIEEDGGNNITIANNQLGNWSVGIGIGAQMPGNPPNASIQISSNTIQYMGYGLYLASGLGTFVTGNQITNALVGDLSPTVSGVDAGSQQIVRDNIFSNIVEEGLALGGNGNVIANDSFYMCTSSSPINPSYIGTQQCGSSTGIMLEGASGNTIVGNLISSATYASINLFQNTDDNQINSNVITNDTTNRNDGILFGGYNGIYLTGGSTGNVLSGNTIQEPAPNSAGIAFLKGAPTSSGNIFYHNDVAVNPAQSGIFVDNANSSTNTWSAPYPIGGNFWSGLTGTDTQYGPNQNLPVKDGIYDSSFVIDSQNIDTYPWVNQSGWLVDTIPPAPITTLNGGTNKFGNILLSWIEPGNDWETGTVSTYAVMVASFPLTQANFNLGQPELGPTPVGSNNQISITENSLPINTTTLDYIAVKSTDAAGNTSSISNEIAYVNGQFYSVVISTQSSPALTQISDFLPPRTSLTFTGPTYSTAPGSAFIYVSSSTGIGLSAIDDASVVFDSAGVGVAETYVAVDGNPFQLYTSSFSVGGEGLHLLRYYSVDKVGNYERVQTSTIAIDATPPTVAQAQIVGPYSYDAEGDVIYSTSDYIALSAADPVSSGVASGLATLYDSVDGQAFSMYTGTFSLTEGYHTIDFYAVDNVRNASVQQSTAAYFIPESKWDTSPPQTSLVFNGPSYSTAPDFIYISSLTSISLSVADASETVDGVVIGGGTKSYISIDGGAFQAYVSSFSVGGEGLHALRYYSVDRAGNTEAVYADSIAVDATSPTVAQFQIVGSSSYYANGDVVYSPADYIVFSAADPVSNGVASGVNIYYSVDGSSYAVFSSTFSLPAGYHSIDYYAMDNVGNASLHESTAAAFGSVSQQVVWTGAAGDGTWSDPANWSDGAMPGPNQTAIIDVSTIVAISSTPTEFGGLLLGNAAGTFSPVLDISTSVDMSGLLLLEPNSTIIQETTDSITAGYLTMASGSVFTSSANYDSKAFEVNVHALGNVIVEAGSTITVDGQGYAGGAANYGAGLGPSPGQGGTPNGAYGGGGGGYGGNGGNSVYGRLGGTTSYGSISSPDNLGSGGGAAYQSQGGAGGGEISLDVGGTLEVDGVLSADGAPGASYNSYGGGGGAGGTINIADSAIAGTGVIEANGGAGENISGGGGGGRIAFQGVFVGAVTVNGGLVLPPGDGAGQGSPGTIGGFLTSTGTVANPSEITAWATQPVTVTQLSSESVSGALVISTGAAQGIAPVSDIFDLGPENTTFSPPLNIEFRYSTGTLAALNILPESIAVYEYFPGQGLVEVPNQINDSTDDVITVQVQTLASIFGIFGKARDVTPPETTLTISNGFSYAVSTLTYVSSAAFFGFSAFDPVVEATSTGVAFTQYRVDPLSPSAAFQTFVSTFSLSAGEHEIDFRSQDNAGNLEPTHTTHVFVDTAMPSIDISSPVANEVFTEGISTITVDFAASDPYGLALSSSAALIETNPPRGIIFGSTEVSVADGQNVNLSGLNPGTWELQASAANPLHYSTVAVAGPFAILRDNQPPRTSLAFSGPSYTTAAQTGFVYVSSSTEIGLSAVDDLSVLFDSAGVVRQTFVSIDSSVFQSYVSSFTMPQEGLNIVRYYSVDDVGNTEAVHTSTIAVDETRPVSQIEIVGTSTTDAQGDLIYSSGTYILFTATDPISNGVASGLSAIYYSLDNSPFEVYSGTFSLTGYHTIAYYAADNVQNAEVAQSTAAFFGEGPQTVSWLGTAGDGNWYNPANWQGGVVPGSNATAVIDTRQTVTISTTGPPVVLYALVIGDAQGQTSPILDVGNSLTISSAAFIEPGAILTQEMLQPIYLANLSVLPGGEITTPANGSVQQYAVNLDVSGDFDLMAGATINVSGLGYGSNQGPGAGGEGGFVVINQILGSGGGHCGSGGNFYFPPGSEESSSTGGAAYDSINNPIDIGSGGGGVIPGPGAGAGAAIINVGGTFDFGGAIEAQGQNGALAGGFGQGGGAGGSVNIAAGTLEGSGVIDADGGTGGIVPGNSGIDGEGGGGGCVAIKIGNIDSSSLSVSAANRESIGGSSFVNAGSGSIYRQEPGQQPTLTIASPQTTPAGSFTLISTSALDGAQTLTLSNFILSNSFVSFSGLTQFTITQSAQFSGAIQIQDLTGQHNLPTGGTTLPAGANVVIATMTFPSVSTLTLTGADLSVSSLTALGSMVLQGNSILTQMSDVPWTIGNLDIGPGSVLTSLANGATKQYEVNVHVLGNMTVEAGSSVTVDGVGYAGGAAGLAAAGPGAGQGSAVNGGGGGGYGGDGGTGHGGTLGGQPYGSVALPDDLGSGGGGSGGVAGGTGGGEIALDVAGTLDINGALSADGSSGTTNGNYGGGGGAGGTIDLDAPILVGTGTIEANGGMGGLGSVATGGGGGAGRIAGAAAFLGQISLNGGAGNSGSTSGNFGSFFNASIGQPSLISPTFINASTTNLSFQWSTGTNPAGTQYLAQLSPATDFSSNLVSTIITNAFASFSGLISNTLYYARVAGLSHGFIATNFTALGSTMTTRAPGETWIGPNGGDWDNASNWNNGAVPVSTDPVTIDANVSVVVYSTEPSIAFGSLTLGDLAGSYSPDLFLSTGSANANGSMTLNPGAALTQATLAPVFVSSITMEPGSEITTPANGSVQQYAVNLDVSGDFDLMAGATINVSGLGYGSNQGPGAGGEGGFVVINQILGSGGGHCGSGGNFYFPPGSEESSSTGGAAYDSINNPIDIGSGGGGVIPGPGAGAGAAIINVGGTFDFGGAIEAQGQNGALAGGFGQGGGAGGSVNIAAGTLEGSGVIDADGGTGGIVPGNSGIDGEGGGGGCVAIKIGNIDSSSLSVSAANRESIGGSSFVNAGSGSIYRQEPGQQPTLTIASPQTTPAGSFTLISTSALDGAQTLTLSNFILSNSFVSFSGLTQFTITQSAQFSGAIQIQDLTGQHNLPTGGTTLPAGANVVIATMTFPSVSTLTLTGADLSVSSLTALGSMVLQGNSILTQMSDVPWTIGNLDIGPGSVLTSLANGATKQYEVNVHVLGNMTVEAGSSVTVDGVGYAGGAAGLAAAGPGAGQGSAVNGGGGGGYGGDGGTGHGGTLGGQPYGSVALPDDLGSGGGGSGGVAGGTGGGEIALDVAGTLDINGALSADGSSGTTNGNYGGGGGAGGTIDLDAPILVGTGTIEANGGMGGNGTIRGGGGGAGGRIAFLGVFPGTTTVLGGPGGGLAQAGDPGTVGPYFAQSTQTVAGLPEFSASANQAVTVAQIPIVSTAGAVVLTTGAAQGIVPAGDIFDVGPEGVLFSPSLTMVFRYSTTTLAELNILPESIAVYEYFPGQGLEEVPGQINDTANQEIIVQVQSLASIFGIFGRAVDITPPVTSLVLSNGFSYATSSLTYVSSSTLFSFSAFDPVIEATSTGVAFTQYRIDASSSAPFQNYVSSFSLAAGFHEIDFRSQDNAGNLEITHSSFVFVDTKTPYITILSPSSGTYVANQSTITISFSASDSFDVSPTSAAALIELAHGSGPVTSSTEIAVTNGEELSPLSLDQGTWELRVQASDFVQNSTTAFSGPLTIIHDIQPPRTSLAISSPEFVNTSSLTYVTDRSSMTLSSIDDLISTGDALGLGVAYQEVIVDSGLPDAVVSTFTNSNPTVGQVFVSSFTLGFSSSSAIADGIHTLDYFAQDIVGNREAVHVATVAVDNTPPQTELSFIGGLQFTGPVPDSVYVSSDAFLALVSTDPLVNGAASGVAFTQYSDNDGPLQVYTTSFALMPGAHLLSYQSQDNVGNLEVLRSAIVLVDQTPPVAGVAISSPNFSVANGVVYVASSTFISIAAQDPALIQLSSAPGTFPGSGVNRVKVAIDSQVFAIYASSVNLSHGLSQGLHVLHFYAVDSVGNIEPVQTSTIAVDLTPPISSLSIGQPSFALSSSTVLVSSTTPLVVLSTDPMVNGVASGVADSFVAIDTGPFAISTGAFTLSQASTSPYVLRFYAVDNVGNAGVIQSSTVVLAETPPSLALFSPAQNSTGIAAVASGQIPVLGGVFDLYLSSWTLSYAQGQNANTGFIFISSGSANVSSTALSAAALGAWNATALSGWQTLRLSAQDLVGNTASVSVNVYIGSPAELMALGNPEVFDMPEGVATDGSGNIYVADTNASQIKVYTATGSLIAAYGDGRHDYDDEGNEIDFSTAARFNHPRGVTVDQAGNFYVADTGNDRVVKLSSAGVVLMTIGKTDKDKERWGFCEPGPLPGQFNHPSGVALDQAGNIYVSDTLNHRVQVFSSSGTFILAFNLPSAESADDGKRDDLKADTPHWVDWAGDWDDRMPLGNPAGIAVDQAGDIFVADAKGGRGLEFSSTGYLLLTIPISEAGVASPQDNNGGGHDSRHGPGHDQDHEHPGVTPTARPYGIAVSADGSRIYISDARSSRILGFDALGDQILSFGSRGHIPDNKAPPANIVFDKPAGLSLAPDGALLVADRNNDRVERFGLPNGRPTLVVPPPRPCFNKISDVVDYDLGGDVSRSDDAGVTVPAGAIDQDMQLSVSTVIPTDMSQMDAMMQTAQKNGAQPVDPPVDYEPEGTQFAKPVTLTLPYNADLVAQAGLPETAVQVNYWNPTQQQWLPLDSTVDPDNHTVTAQTSHFSLYQVLTSTSVTPLALIPANGGATIFNVYNFPNPFDLVSKTVTTINGAGAQVVRGTMIAISLPPNISGGGEIKIFNIAGHLVKTIALGSLQGGNYYYQEWDGTDDDGRDVASGVYIGELKVGGQTKMFKMALIKGSNL